MIFLLKCLEFNKYRIKIFGSVYPKLGLNVKNSVPVLALGSQLDTFIVRLRLTKLGDLVFSPYFRLRCQPLDHLGKPFSLFGRGEALKLGPENGQL